MKKPFFLFAGLLVLSAAVCLAGCGRADRAEVLTVWHWMSDRQDAFSLLAERYYEQTGVRVRFELFAPSVAYSQKITAAAQAGVLPDIYGVLDRKAVLASYVRAGLVADLSQEYAAQGGLWERSLVPYAVDALRFFPGNPAGVRPGIYGVPLDLTGVQMLYNRRLLRKAGVDRPPGTMDEFTLAVDKLRRTGIVPFVSGFGELWLADSLATVWAINILGEERLMATYRGEVPYTEPDWIRLFSLFADLARRGTFMPGMISKGNKYAEQDFALERAAFAFNGSWGVNVYASMNPALDYGVMTLPVVDAARPLRSWGGPGTMLLVNQKSPRQSKAVDFLKWLTALPQQSFLAQTTRNLPVNRDALREMTPPLSDFYRLMEPLTHPYLWPENEDPLVSEAFAKGIQALIIGETNPRAVAETVQKIKQRQMNRKGF